LALSGSRLKKFNFFYHFLALPLSEIMKQSKRRIIFLSVFSADATKAHCPPDNTKKGNLTQGMGWE
jgi:hypothetical protein